MHPRTLAALLLVPALNAQQALPLPALADCTRLVETAAGESRTWPQMLDALAELDVVFLGETHLDDTTHRVELAVLEGLLERKKGKVVLSMEMFERDSQPVLDDYLAGKIEEAEFVARSGAWSNYRTGYRALVETARAAGIPVVAANFPRSLRRALRGGGKDAVERLTPEQRALMPETIYPASEGYWERVDRAVRGHAAMGMGGGGTPEERLYDTQNLWDNSMGENVAKARAAHPDSVVLHVAGGFHVAYRDGTVAQFARRSPDSRYTVLQVSPTSGPEMGNPTRDRAVADWMIYARAVGRGLNEGTMAVATAAELRYRLEVPGGKTGLPLLVWLPDRAADPRDDLALWQAVLGERAALAVVEQPFPELQDDLALGGRYAFGDGFRSDYSRVIGGLTRIVEYLTRHYGVDASRVVVAGAGDGGAVVLWAAIYGEWLGCDYLALDPNDLTRLSLEGLPDQEPAARGLGVVLTEFPTPKLLGLLGDFAKVGLDARMAGQGRALLRELVAERLGLDGGAAAAGGAPTYLLPGKLPRARAWAELYAAQRRALGMATEVAPRNGAFTADAKPIELRVGGDGQWPVETFRHGEGLPLAGGPFGGTTVVVLPADVTESDRAKWLEYESANVIKRRSMFSNLVVAEMAGERSLRQVIGQLEGMRRLRVLVVPAVFCADAETMRALKTGLGDAAEGIDLLWLPGLGGELARAGR